MLDVQGQSPIVQINGWKDRISENLFLKHGVSDIVGDRFVGRSMVDLDVNSSVYPLHRIIVTDCAVLYFYLQPNGM